MKATSHDAFQLASVVLVNFVDSIDLRACRCYRPSGLLFLVFMIIVKYVYALASALLMGDMKRVVNEVSQMEAVPIYTTNYWIGAVI